MRKFIQIVLVFVLCFVSIQAYAQQKRKKEQIKNLPKFDLQYYHFGFVLSLNSSSLIFDYKEQIIQDTNVIAINNVSRPGFNLGMLASLDLSGNWHLRFIPTLSFNERVLEYTFLLENGSTEKITKDVNSTYIDFPLLFKYRTNRMNNVAPYVILGAQFSIDVASQKNVDNTNANIIIIKLDNTNFSAATGIGVDFFLPYFKFGIELKANIGIKNMFIDDNTLFSAPIESIRTQSIMLSFTFEG